MRNRKKNGDYFELWHFELMCIRTADAILRERRNHLQVGTGQLELEYANVSIDRSSGRTAVELAGLTRGGWGAIIKLYVVDARSPYERFRFEVTLHEESQLTLVGTAHWDHHIGERVVTFENLPD